jgi:hypothetical protein
MSSRIFLYIMLFMVLCVHDAGAQSITAGGQSYMTVGDTSILVNGSTFTNNMRIQFNGGNNTVPNWKLTVQPLTAYFTAQQSSPGDIAQFGYGPNWPIQYFSVKLNPGASQNSWSNPNSVNAIGAVTTTVPLSSSEITLVERSDYKIIASDYFALSYDLILSGSRQLLTLHRDNYIIVMRFRLYSNSGALISQMDYNHQIGLWPGWMHLPQSTTPQISNGILLQNGGNNVTLNFGASPTAYATGVESILNNSLQVSSSDGKYQVKVQTLSNYFTNAGATSTVPVSKIQLTATPSTSSVASTYNPVNLSTTSNTLITNNGSAGIVNTYNLKYSTKQNSNQNAFMNIAAGNYATQITFIMNPL